jgi:hypothetical protein
MDAASKSAFNDLSLSYYLRSSFPFGGFCFRLSVQDDRSGFGLGSRNEGIETSSVVRKY